MQKFGTVLSTCDLQCGFKENGSTNMCTFMVKETLQYDFQNNSNVYAAVLDASKAFDRIEYCKLFNMLIDRKMPPLVINLYTKQSTSVKWNNTYSTNFGITNGVKQGGVLTPVLLCIYLFIYLNILHA